MRIRKSKKEDLERMMEIYAHARDFMAKTGNPRQWGPTNWPPEELIVQDIESDNSYVCIDEEDCVVGTFFFIQGEDIEETYRTIDGGSWLDDSAYGVVHRIAADRPGRGIGAFCLNYAYEQCHHLRIDTHEDNKVMQRLLEKEGFVYCGIIYVHEDKDPRKAYEKSENI